MSWTIKFPISQQSPPEHQSRQKPNFNKILEICLSMNQYVVDALSKLILHFLKLTADNDTTNDGIVQI